MEIGVYTFADLSRDPKSGHLVTSAVTALSSDDPVRVFQAFATLDPLSGGRPEIMAGRGGGVTALGE